MQHAVHRTTKLDSVFSSLADPTRRDILLRVSREALSIGELAEPYDMSFAAVAKHVAVLETARLVKKARSGKKQLVQAVPTTIKIAQQELDKYEQLWNDRFAALDAIFAAESENVRSKK